MALQVNNFTGFNAPGGILGIEPVATSGSPILGTGTVRNGTRSLELNNTSDQYDLPWLYDATANISMSDQGAGHVIGFAIRKTANPSALSIVAAVIESGVILSVRLDTDGTLVLRDQANTTLDTSSALNNDQWYYVEVFFQGDNASGNWEWQIGAVSEGSGSTGDFDEGGTLNKASVLRFGRTGSGTYTVRVDDVYILSGAVAGDMYGDCEVFQYDHGVTIAAADAGLNATAQTDLTSGTWDDAEDGNAGTFVAMDSNPHYGTVDAAGPFGDGNVDGDSNIKAIKASFILKRGGGSAIVHYIGLGDSADGNSPGLFDDDTDWGPITTSAVGYNIVTEIVPTSSQNIRFGFGTGGGQNIDGHEMYAQLLHVPSAVAPSGVGAHVLAPISQAATAAERLDGVGGHTLARAVQSAIAVMQPSGVGGHTLAPAAQAGAGAEEIPGVGAHALAAAEQAAIGNEEISGAGAHLLEPAEQAATGEETISGVGTHLLAKAAQAGEGGMQPDGVGSHLLEPAEQAATGEETISGVGAHLLEKATQAGAGGMQPDGVGEHLLEPATQAATGEETISGVGGHLLEPAVQAGVGDQSVETTGTGSHVLEKATQAATGDEIISGAGAHLLAKAIQAGIGGMQPDGVGGHLLEPATQAATGEETISGAGAHVLAKVSQAGVGVLQPSGVGSYLLEKATQIGFGVETVTGVGAYLLEKATQAGIGQETIPGVGSHLLKKATQAGVGGLQPDGVGEYVLVKVSQAGVGTETILIGGVGAHLLAAVIQAAVGDSLTVSTVFTTPINIALLDDTVTLIVDLDSERIALVNPDQVIIKITT